MRIACCCFQLNQYKSLDKLVADFDTVFNNAMQFNVDESLLYQVTESILLSLLLKELKRLNVVKLKITFHQQFGHDCELIMYITNEVSFQNRV